MREGLETETVIQSRCREGRDLEYVNDEKPSQNEKRKPSPRRVGYQMRMIYYVEIDPLIMSERRET